MAAGLILHVSYYPFIAFFLANPRIPAQGYGYRLGLGHPGVYPCPSLVGLGNLWEGVAIHVRGLGHGWAGGLVDGT